MRDHRAKEWRQSLTWGKRLAIVLIVFVAIIYGVLKMVERSKEPVRLGLEDYLEQATGGDADITDLTTLHLVPDVVFRLNTVIVRDRANRDRVIAKADKAYVAMPFWRMMLGLRDYRGFEIQGLEIATGTLLPKKITLRFAGITDTGKSVPRFIAEGVYSDHDILFTLELNRSGDKKPLYSLPDYAPVTFKLGNLEGGGVLSRDGGTHLEKGVLSNGQQRADFIAKNISVDPPRADLEGTIDGAAFKGSIVDDQLKLNSVSSEKSDIKTIRSFVESMQDAAGLKGTEHPAIVMDDIPETK